MAGRNMSKDSISKAKMPKAGIEEHDIPQTRAQKAAGEKAKRRQKGNIAMLRTSIAIWMLLCAVLLVRIKNLNETIEALKNRTDRLTQIVMDQQDILDQLLQAGSGGQGGNQIGSGAQTGESVQGSGGLSGGQDRYQTGDDGQGLMGTAEWEEEVSAAHKVYLTFDDGPGANTQKILDILDEYDVKATFS